MWLKHPFLKRYTNLNLAQSATVMYCYVFTNKKVIYIEKYKQKNLWLRQRFFVIQL